MTYLENNIFCVKQKIKVKIFKMINKATTLVKQASCDCKRKFNSNTWILIHVLVRLVLDM